MLRKIIFSALLAFPGVLFAANPSVSSFTQTANTMNSGQVTSFSWSTLDAGGYSFIIPCMDGLKLKKSDGSAFSCDTKLSSIATGADGIDLLIYNISGGLLNIHPRVIPKDAGTGADYDTGGQSLSLLVYPAMQPIDSFTGTTTIASSAPYTIAWTSSILDGVNLSMSCSPNIRATSTSYTGGFLPCDKPIFTTDLPGSGSVDLYVSNTSPSSETFSLTLLPAIKPGLYDGSHSATISTIVQTNISPDPSVTFFVASSTLEQVLESAPLHFSWGTQNAASTNLQLSCNSAITATALINNATTTLPCGTLAFPTPFGPNDGTDISFANKNSNSEPISVSLFPGKSTTEFDGTRGKTLNLRILAQGATPYLPPSYFVTVPPSMSSTTNTGAAGCTPLARFSTATGQPCPVMSATALKITKILRRGSKGEEVRMLQSYLKNDPTIYPEGSTDGSFGPATERAIKKFQVKHNIARPGVPGYGVVGPKTRAVLNSITF